MVYYWDSTGIWGSGILRHPPYWTRSRPQSRRTLVLHRIVFFGLILRRSMCLSPFQTQTQQMYIQTQPHDICIFIIKWLLPTHKTLHALESQNGSHLPLKLQGVIKNKNTSYHMRNMLSISKMWSEYSSMKKPVKFLCCRRCFVWGFNRN